MPPDDMEVVRESVTLDHLAELAETGFGNLLKAVVDVGRGIMAIGGEMHADEEAALLGLGSSQTDLWGVNLYPSQYGQSDWIEFDSMINIRPGRAIDRVASRTRLRRRRSWPSLAAWSGADSG